MARRDADFWRQVNDYIAFMKGSLPQSLLAVMSDEMILSEAKKPVKEVRQPVVVGPLSAS